MTEKIKAFMLSRLAEIFDDSISQRDVCLSAMAICMLEATPTDEQLTRCSTSSNKTTFYVCDPSKNKNCHKNTCQVRCKLTPDVKFAKLDEEGNPIVEIVV